MNSKHNVSYVLFSVALIAIISACSASQTERQPPNADPVVTATSIPVSTLTAITAIAPTTAPTATSPAPEPSEISPAVEGNQIAFNGISFAIPDGMASGTHNEIVPQTSPNETMFVWPQHTKIVLQGYVLQSQNQPQILIFPVNEYETMSNDPAASQYDAKTMITTLQNILNTQQFPSEGYFPFLPDQHATQVFHVQEKILSFQNGNGIRYITEFSQAHYPTHSRELPMMGNITCQLSCQFSSLNCFPLLRRKTTLSIRLIWLQRLLNSISRKAQNRTVRIHLPRLLRLWII